jgi:hypothetical protein
MIRLLITKCLDVSVLEGDDEVGDVINELGEGVVGQELQV